MMARPFNPRPARPGTISRPTISRPGRPVIQRPSVGSWAPTPSGSWVVRVANRNQTSKSVASQASRILTDKRFGKASKSVAGSALSQTRKGGKRK